MNALLLGAAAIAVLATTLVIVERNAIHALLYLALSFVAVAVGLYLVGATFAALLEIIVYAGAIVVLLVFGVMLLDPRRPKISRSWWTLIIPLTLVAALVIELFAALSLAPEKAQAITASQVGATLYGPYIVGVELGSVLLLAGVVGALSIGTPDVLGSRSKNDNR